MSSGCAEGESHDKNAALEKISCPQGIFRTSKSLTFCTRSEPSFRCGDPSDRKTTKQVAYWLLRHTLKCTKSGIKFMAASCSSSGFCHLSRPWSNMAVSQDSVSSGCLSAGEKPERKSLGDDVLASKLVLKIIWLTRLCWDTTESKYSVKLFNSTDLTNSLKKKILKKKPTAKKPPKPS